MKNHLLCCDWGTTSFRLRLINVSDLEMLAEILSLEGVASTFDSWKATENGFIAKERFFMNLLRTQIDLLAEKVGMKLSGIPVVISGMASSSIGMQEVPYSNLPFDLDGNQVNVQRIDADADFPHDILLISGVKSEFDVMRGEETQLIGLSALLNLADQDAILIFPGTHSKHLYIRNSHLTDFHTYMTGEIYKLISHYSILKESIELSALPDFSESELAAFALGVRESNANGILKSLFRVRTNQLFNKLEKKENAFYLSGLLIGSELVHLADNTSARLVLCSGNNLYELYKLAIKELNFSGRTTTVASNVIDEATIAGQLKIFQNQTLTLNNTSHE